MAWTKVASLKALKAQQKMKVEYQGVSVLLAMVHNKPYAINNQCPHMKASLYEGTIEDECVVCKAHGAKINLTNGLIERKAKILFISMPTKKTKTYMLKVEGDEISIQ